MKVVTSDEIAQFYEALGEALFATQIVEGHLHKLLTILVDLADRQVSQAEADEILERYRRLTLGQLIGRAREAAFPTDILSPLEKLNTERRWVVHRLQVAAFDDYKMRTSEDFRLETMERLSTLTNRSYAISKMLVGHLLERKKPHEDPRFGNNLLKELKKSGIL